MTPGPLPEPGPCVMVIFGGSGDLTRRKIAPALYALAHEGRLPERAVILGFGRTQLSDDGFRQHLEESAAEFSRLKPPDELVWNRLAGRTFYHQGDYGSGPSFRSLRERVSELDRRFGVGGGRLFYVAVPPQLTSDILANLSEVGLLERRLPEEEPQAGYVRVVLEKPFGRDLASARQLNRLLEQELDESQVFRMDHYLGKETVQNILVLRFANAVFEPVWNHSYVKQIHMMVAETVGVEHRARYFETAGALRDVMQNHVLQLLTLFAMEPPASLDPESVRDEKAKVLRCLRRLSGEDLVCSVVRGQYGAGEVGGVSVPGYRDEEGVSRGSTTETFIALRTYIDNWRWAGVPFYLATGKRLAARLTEVAVEFREVPNVLFRAMQDVSLETNLLKVRVQPDEGVSLRISTKVPGHGLEIRSAEMDFPYGSLCCSASPEAYERLLLDVMAGNSTLFTRRDEVELAWEFVEPILRHWESEPAPAFPNYAPGTWGPIPAADFFHQDTCYGRLPRPPDGR